MTSTKRQLADACDVVESGGRLTDLASFYTLPSTVLGNTQHSEIKAAFQYYTVARGTPLKRLMGDALILATALGHDVFNALDLLDNSTFLEVRLAPAHCAAEVVIVNEGDA